MAQATPKHKLYTAAYNCFVEQGMSCVAISDLLGISKQTLSGWRRSMTWDDKRKAMLAAPGKIRESLLEEMQHVMDGLPRRIDTDGLSKIAKALTYFDGKVPLTVVITVLKELDSYIAEIAPQEVIRHMELTRQFAGHRAAQDALK